MILNLILQGLGMDSTMHSINKRPGMGEDQEASGDGSSYAPYAYYHIPTVPITVHDQHSSYSRSLADHMEARAEIANDNSSLNDSNPFDLYENPMPYQNFSLASSGYPLNSNRAGITGATHRVAHLNQDSTSQRPDDKYAYVRTDKGKLTWGPVAGSSNEQGYWVKPRWDKVDTLVDNNNPKRPYGDINSMGFANQDRDYRVFDHSEGMCHPSSSDLGHSSFDKSLSEVAGSNPCANVLYNQLSSTISNKSQKLCKEGLMEKYTRLQRELEETGKLLKSNSNTVPGISNPFPVSDPILSSEPYASSGIVGEDVRDQLYEAGYEGISSLFCFKKAT